jgi:hypothetical protein
MVMPVPKARPMSLQILESTDTVEPLVDFLRSKTFKLACCSKKMQELYGKEAKCWKSFAFFSTENEDQTIESTLNRALMDYEKPRLAWGRTLWNMPFYYPLLEAAISITSSYVLYGKDFRHIYLRFKSNPTRVWSVVEKAVRRNIKLLLAKRCKDFKICLVGCIERRRNDTGVMERLVITEDIPVYEFNA